MKKLTAILLLLAAFTYGKDACAYKYAVLAYGGQFFSDEIEVVARTTTVGVTCTGVTCAKKELVGRILGAGFEAYYNEKFAFLFTYEQFDMKKSYGSQNYGSFSLEQKFKIKATITSINAEGFAINNDFIQIYGGFGFGRGRGEVVINSYASYYDTAFIYNVNGGLALRYKKVGIFGTGQYRFNKFKGRSASSSADKVKFDVGGLGWVAGLKIYL